MGHCEMLLAVAGLDADAVEQRTRRLAGGDWSHFSPQEQAAFAFAQKQAQEPAAVRDADIAELVRQLGPERALHVIWWTCRCHYMTTVADAFQLPLERENVFQPPPGPKERAR
jgi:hypothetical protein